MISFEDYRNMDGTELAAQIKQGALSREEVLECAISRAKQVNPAINAIIHPYYDEARSYLQKNQSDGVLAGVPMLLKDLVGEVKGWVTQNGTAAYNRTPAQSTSSLYGIVHDGEWMHIGTIDAIAHVESHLKSLI